MKILFVAVLCLVPALTVAAAAASTGDAADALGLFPRPLNVTAAFDGGCITLSSAFTIEATGSGGGSDILTAAMARYARLALAVPPSAASMTAEALVDGPPSVPRPATSLNCTSGGADTPLKSLVVSVDSAEETLQLGVDESYSLHVSAPSAASLRAATVWGALRGLETFSQLVEVYYTSTSEEGAAPVPVHSIPASSVTISDAPLFAWRGLLVDTGRRFLSVDLLRAAIDSMAYFRLNTMHWHIVDDQAFPLESAVHPKLSDGAFTPRHRYSATDVAGIVAYAKQRGIRVVVETDMPGHSISWGVGYPDLLTSCPGIHSTPMDPTQDATYSFLGDFLEEVAGTFFDNYIHLGGDEVNQDCWKANANVTSWMAKNNIKSYDGVQAEFEKRMVEQVTSAPINRSVVVWEEVFVNRATWTMPADTVVEIWKEQPDDKHVLEQAVQAGLRVIWTTPGWYLDYHLGSGTQLSSDWRYVYGFSPLSNATLTVAEQKLVMGGEVCMWAPMQDATNWMSVVFPRAGAAAERLWSAVDGSDLDSATLRLRAQRCRAMYRGIASAPIIPAGFTSFCPFWDEFVYSPSV